MYPIISLKVLKILILQHTFVSTEPLNNWSKGVIIGFTLGYKTETPHTLSYNVKEKKSPMHIEITREPHTRPDKKLLPVKKFLGFIASCAVFLAIFAPASAHAFSFTSFFRNLFWGGDETLANASSSDERPFPFLSPVVNSDPVYAQGGADLQVVDKTAIMPLVGPLGSIADVTSLNNSDKITTYTVHKGDSISLVAKTFGVSVSTIRWANDLGRGDPLKEGQVLVILPVTGVKHVVKKGDTIASIAKKYGGDPDDIYSFNDLQESEKLAEGSVVIVPDGELPLSAEPSGSRPQYARGGGAEIVGYFMRPLVGGVKTQGIHGFNGVDIAASIGTPLFASAAGTVIQAKTTGWNGGYGKYIVISHSNGTQTVYGHLSAVHVETGWHVAQGQFIGEVGSTGKSTGSHVHFEIRGAKNPF